MTLANVISSVREALYLVRPQIPRVPPKMSSVASQLSERMERVGVMSDGFDHDAILETARQTNQNGDWDLLSDAELRRIARVLRRSASPLEEDFRFLRRYLQQIRGRERPLLYRALIDHYLRHFDDSPGITRIGDFLSKAVQIPAFGESLDRWNQRRANYHLFNPKIVAGRLADEILKQGDANAVLKDAGIDRDARTAGIGAAAFKAACARVRALLQRGAGYAKIGALTKWFHPAPEEFRYQNERSALADALLLPWRDREPPLKVKDELEHFLDSAYGDPRFHNDRWAGTSDDAKHVRMRWIAEQDLEFFIKVVDNTTGRKDQWGYRRAFWRAYIDGRFTKGTWVAFGRRARVTARNVVKEDQNSTQAGPTRFGTLTGGDPRHSVLFLRVGNLIIADWSFNGKLRIWRERNQHAPRMYQEIEPYQRHLLMQGANFEQIHWPVEGRNNWQARAHDFIQRHTGIRISSNRYMP